jgi:hypothetical protein
MMLAPGMGERDDGCAALISVNEQIDDFERARKVAARCGLERRWV